MNTRFTRTARPLAIVLLSGVAASASAQTVADLGLVPGDTSIAPATNSQQDHAIAKGSAGYLVAWSDYRARSVNSQAIQSDGDVFGVRLNGAGEPIDAVPFMIAGGLGLQRKPMIAWNGENYLVLFTSQDPVGGYFGDQLRGVRVSPSGQVLDATPLLFASSTNWPADIGLQVAGLNGQWLVTRCIYHGDGYGTYIAGQRVSGTGQVLDATPIMLSDWVYGQTRTVTANGEYLVVGPDWNNSATIKARRVSAAGQPIGNQFNVKSLWIGSNGSEYYTAWISNFTGLVGSRMSPTGVLTNPSGSPLAEVSIYLDHVNIDHDATQWWVEHGIADELRTIRVDNAGTVLDPNGGVLLPLDLGNAVAYAPKLAPIAGGGVNVLWYDGRASLGSDTNVYKLPVSALNAPGTESCVSTSSKNQRSPDLAEGPSGQQALVYVSESANDDRVKVMFLDAAGVPTLTEPIEAAQAPTIGRAAIAWNGQQYMLTWDQGPQGLTPIQIKGRRMNLDGTFIDPAPFDVMPGHSPDVGALGDDFLFASARFASNPQFIDLWGRRFDGPTGQPIDGASIPLGFGYFTGTTQVRSDGAQWLVGSGSQWCHDCGQGDATLAKVPPTGAPQQSVNPTPFSGGTGDLDIAFSGQKYLIVWRNNSLANADNSIGGRIMNADGTFLTGAFTIAQAAGRQLMPRVTWDGTTFVVAWDDQRNQKAFFDARTDIYAARVSETGQVLDPSGIAIVKGAEGDANVAVQSTSPGYTLLASSRFMLQGALDSYRVGLSGLGDAPMVCYADCDADASLTIDDFICFQTFFALGDPFADCDADSVLTIDDFICFQTLFAIGC